MLDQLTAIAHAKLPQDQHSRLEMGHAIVLAGGVFPEDDGIHFSVCSQEGEEEHTYLVNSACPCKDAHFQAPQSRCKHWFSALLYKRTLEELAKPPAPEEEPPADETLQIPSHYLVTIQGVRCIRLIGLIHIAHERGIRELRADFTYNDDNVSLAHAVAIFPANQWFPDGGHFEESGDSTPTNAKRVGEHWRRISLARAKARVLRDALDINMVSVEEME
jgi:hypothetical protein